MPEGIKIDIEQKTQALKALTSQLSDRNIDKAYVRAINKTIQKANTDYRRQIRDNYNLSYSETKDIVVSQKATYSYISGSIQGRRDPISLSRFKPEFISGSTILSIRSLKNKKTGERELQRKSKSISRNASRFKGVNFMIKKGKEVNLPFAFMTGSDKNKGVEKQVFARGKYIGNKFVRSKDRYPIGALKSVSPFGMMTKSEISEAIEKGATDDMRKEFERQVNLLLRQSGAK